MSDSPTCKDELNLPRTNWFQVSSARIRALMVAGAMPERSIIWENCGGDKCWFLAMLPNASSTSASLISKP